MERVVSERRAFLTLDRVGACHYVYHMCSAIPGGIRRAILIPVFFGIAASAAAAPRETLSLDGPWQIVFDRKKRRPRRQVARSENV